MTNNGNHNGNAVHVIGGGLAGSEARRNLHGHQSRGRLHLKGLPSREPVRHLHRHQLIPGRDCRGRCHDAKL